jgi:hypothetical protein
VLLTDTDVAGVPVAVTAGLAVKVTDGPDGTEEADEAEAVGEVGELGEVGGADASCAQAAMTTRSLTGSALPPTPLRSMK